MDADRRQQIIRLLQTRDDHLLQPVRRSDATAGFVHNVPHRESCPDCLANGRPEGMPGCETCHGRSYIEVVFVRDPYANDKTQPYGLSPDRHEARRARDAEIDRLQAQTRLPWVSAADELADADRHPFGWERERRRMYRQFDYRPLDVALDDLLAACPAAYHVLHAVFVYGWQQQPAEGSAMASVAELGLRLLSDRLPDRLRAPGQPPALRVAAGPATRAVRGLELRDREIAAAVLERRLSSVEVAEAWRLSVRQVNRIVQRATEGSAA